MSTARIYAQRGMTKRAVGTDIPKLNRPTRCKCSNLAFLAFPGCPLALALLPAEVHFGTQAGLAVNEPEITCATP